MAYTTLLFARLNELSLGKPFEAFTHGTFTDMHGRRVTITKEQLELLAKNTAEVLLGKTEGLPIDAEDHKRGDAAGWIRGVELIGDVLRLVPEWTELGIQKISKGLQKLFSVSIDMEKLVIVGGSLTNWPAVKGLRPVELSESKDLYEYMLDDESHDEYASRVRSAFMAAHNEMHGDRMCCWPGNVYEDYLTISSKGRMMKVGFSESKDGNIEVGKEDDWKPVRLVPVEMAEKIVKDSLAGIQNWFVQTFRPAQVEEEFDMPNKDDLKLMIAEALKEILPGLANGSATAPAATPPATPAPEVQAFADLPALRAQLTAEIEAAMRTELEAVKTQAGKTFNLMLAEMHESQRVVDFARSVTDGSVGDLALPMPAERIEKFLKSLNINQRAEAEALFGEVVRTGLVDFSVRGRPGQGPKLKPLPENLAADLDAGKIVVADLSSDILAPIVGDVAQYDLSKWQAKK